MQILDNGQEGTEALAPGDCRQLISNNHDNHVSLVGDSFLAEHSVETLSLAITYIWILHPHKH